MPHVTEFAMPYAQPRIINANLEPRYGGIAQGSPWTPGATANRPVPVKGFRLRAQWT